MSRLFIYPLSSGLERGILEICRRIAAVQPLQVDRPVSGTTPVHRIYGPLENRSTTLIPSPAWWLNGVFQYNPLAKSIDDSNINQEEAGYSTDLEIDTSHFLLRTIDGKCISCAVHIIFSLYQTRSARTEFRA